MLINPIPPEMAAGNIHNSPLLMKQIHSQGNPINGCPTKIFFI